MPASAGQANTQGENSCCSANGECFCYQTNVCECWEECSCFQCGDLNELLQVASDEAVCPCGGNCACGEMSYE